MWGETRGCRYWNVPYTHMKLSMKKFNKSCKKECSVYLLLMTCASGDMHIYLLERNNIKILLVKTQKLTKNCPGKVIGAAILCNALLNHRTFHCWAKKL